MKTFLIDDFVGRLGENAEENWQLLSDSRPTDVFFHLSSLPSGYVVIDTNSLTPKQISEIATILKENTKYRSIKNVKVDYTPVSNVKKGRKVGEAFYLKQKNICKILV